MLNIIFVTALSLLTVFVVLVIIDMIAGGRFRHWFGSETCPRCGWSKATKRFETPVAECDLDVDWGGEVARKCPRCREVFKTVTGYYP